MIYFDYAATTPVCENALAALNESFQNDFANPHAAYTLSKKLNAKLEAKREELLGLLGAKKGSRLIFTSSATEANNMVLQGLNLGPKATILNSPADHPSTVKVVEHLGENHNIGHFVLNSHGVVDEQKLLAMIDGTTSLVVFTHVNNMSGVITDVFDLSKKIKAINPKCHIHVDAVQSFGKIPFTLKDSMIDSLSISAHKTYGPKGCAALYLREGVEIRPMLIGGGQEGGLRSSTVSYPLINGFLAAANWSLDNREEKLAKAKKWNLWLREKMQGVHKNIAFPFSHVDTSPYVIGMLFRGISSDILLRHLEMKEVYISSSSACSSKIKGQNPTYDALGIAVSDHKSFMRVSFGDMTTDEDFNNFISIFSSVIDDIRMLIK
ncbi:aminotransferase, class V [Bacteriovorax sp. BSW11_IV]|uniref:cysteine desulfurase family protein n=1 Tax=Bacteriovorax sp. BSW11_IV TaxID=1353529 RepID=UPI00038A2D68|nr:aminotransferase class V-fold PLP-dependent enzyme [Bacteriovorax sp. BSW11_IV]EQC49227.1 aminotransferase, class V [Bacteriovorax sp. BSW11_IV]